MNDTVSNPIEILDEEGAGGGASAEESNNMKKRKIKFESKLDREDAVVYFQAILDGLRKGRLQLKQGEELLIFTPASKLALEVKAGKKDDKEKISFELSWHVEMPEDLEVS